MSGIKVCVVVLLLGAGCSSFGGSDDGGGASSGVPGAPDGGQDGPVPISGVPGIGVTISAVTDRTIITQGVSVDIPIHITRESSHAEAIRIVVNNAPPDIKVEATNIPQGSTDGKVTITPNATATQGPLDISISAVSDEGASAGGSVPIFVRGGPGTIDTTFAPATLGLSATASSNATLSVLSDGSLVVAGDVGTGGRLVKVDSEGKMLASSDMALGAQLASLSDGRFLSFSTTSVVRFSDKLVLDSSFNGGGGAITLSIGTIANVQAVDTHAMVLSKGPLSDLGTGDYSQALSVTRLTADGTSDAAFTGCSFSGITNDLAAGIYLGAQPLYIDAGGQVRFVGTERGDFYLSFLFGCASSGARNLGMSAGNELRINPAPGGSDGTFFPSIVGDASGGFFIASAVSTLPAASRANKFIHLNAAGAADTPAFVHDLIGARPVMTLQPDKSVLIADTTGAMPNTVLAVRRFKPNGTEDTTFAHASSSSVKTPYAMVIQKDGRIVVLASDGANVVLLRYWG